VAKRKSPPPVAAPPPAAPLRLGVTLCRRQGVALAVITAVGLAAFAGFLDRLAFYDERPFVAVALTFSLLAAVYDIERRALAATFRSSARFAGVGLLAPILWWVVPIGAITPIAAMQGYTTYRLGLGSVFPPAFAGSILTGVVFGPTAGLLACAGHVWGGMAALLLTRGRG
jgi:hypothetical protein